jgi:hypothetical protein
VTLELQNAIQEPSTRKAFLTRRRDESWEKAAQRAFGFPVKFDTEAQFVEESHVIACLADFEEQAPRQLKEGSVHVSPRTPLSFPIGIKAVFNEEVASIRIPNNTPVDQPERLLSTRWCVPVKIADEETTVWLPNKEYQFVSVRPWQKAAMTEAMIEANTQPTEFDLLVTVCDGPLRYPLTVRVPINASWDQVKLT